MEEFRAYQILVGHDTLDGRHDVFVANARLELFQVTLQIGRRSDEHQRVVLLHYLVKVAREGYLVDVEVDTHQVGRVVAKSLEVFYTIVATHIPTYVVSLSHYNLGYSRSPRASTNNRYSSAVVH